MFISVTIPNDVAHEISEWFCRRYLESVMDDDINLSYEMLTELAQRGSGCGRPNLRRIVASTL